MLHHGRGDCGGALEPRGQHGELGGTSLARQRIQRSTNLAVHVVPAGHLEATCGRGQVLEPTMLLKGSYR